MTDPPGEVSPAPPSGAGGAPGAFALHCGVFPLSAPPHPACDRPARGHRGAPGGASRGGRRFPRVRVLLSPEERGWLFSRELPVPHPPVMDGAGRTGSVRQAARLRSPGLDFAVLLGPRSWFFTFSLY